MTEPKLKVVDVVADHGHYTSVRSALDYNSLQAVLAAEVAKLHTETPPVVESHVMNLEEASYRIRQLEERVTRLEQMPHNKWRINE